MRAGYEEVSNWPEDEAGQIDTFRAGRLLWVSNYVAQFERQYLQEHLEFWAGPLERFLDTGKLRPWVEMGTEKILKPGEAGDQNQPQRVRVHFAKTDAMRFIGNLDLHKAWERACRRAGLPLAYSQGYNPQPKLNLASALPWDLPARLSSSTSGWNRRSRLKPSSSGLRAAAPPGIEIRTIEEVGLQEPTLQSQLVSARYRVTLLEPFPELEERLAELLAASSLPRQRREKTMTCARCCWRRAPYLRTGTGTPGWSCSCRWAKAPPVARTKCWQHWVTIRTLLAWSAPSWCSSRVLAKLVLDPAIMVELAAHGSPP